MKKIRSTTWQFAVLLFAVSAIWILGALLLHNGPVEWSLEQRALIGDSFGSINALFAGCAFAGVVYAILLQREELKLQRDELRMTRSELARSASAQERSSASQSEQLELQAQLAKLTALTALLEWEKGKPAVAALARNLPEGSGNVTVDKIHSILRSLER